MRATVSEQEWDDYEGVSDEQALEGEAGLADFTADLTSGRAVLFFAIPKIKFIMHLAAHHNSPTRLAWLVSRGVDINTPTRAELDAAGHDGFANIPTVLQLLSRIFERLAALVRVHAGDMIKFTIEAPNPQKMAVVHAENSLSADGLAGAHSTRYATTERSPEPSP